MTISDNWLLDRAHKRKTRNLQEAKNGAPAARSMPPIDDLWSQLQKETKRQAAVYTDALGDPTAVTVDTPPDQIEVRVPDGRVLILRVDRERRRLSESFRSKAGAVRIRQPIIAFSTDTSGAPAFNFGGLAGAAGSLLRRMIG